MKTNDCITIVLCALTGLLLLVAGLMGRNITYIALGCFFAALGVARWQGSRSKK